MKNIVSLNDTFSWSCGSISPDDVQEAVNLDPTLGDKIEAILILATCTTDAKGLLLRSTMSPALALAIIRVLDVAHPNAKT